MTRSMNWHLRGASALVIGTLVFGASSHAATIAWTDWTSATGGASGTASGSIALSPAISVTYAGQTTGRLVNYPSWNPASTFSGGTVSNAPPQADSSIGLTGGTAQVNTLSFSAPVTDPVMAIWSLGAPGNPATFNFTSAEPFALQSGGPSAEYGGTSITVSGSTVSGAEGDGVVEFSGTFSSLTWTNPSFESYYAFTVGIAGAATTSVTPEPSSVILFLFGILLSVLVAVRRTKLVGLSKHGSSLE